MTLASFRSRLAVLCLAFAACAAVAQADVKTEVQRLYQAGERQAALAKLDEAIAQQPGDARLRFLKGVLQAETGQQAQAVETYQRLTQDFPELPEPFNNLAVIYALQGRLDEARDALETALRNDPHYATAQQNLGDVYLRLAQRAYEQAGAQTPELDRKLQLLRSLTGRPAAAASSDNAGAPPARGS